MAPKQPAAEEFSLALLKAAGIEVDPTTVTSVVYEHSVGRLPRITVEHFARDLDGQLVPERSELTFEAVSSDPVPAAATAAGLVDTTTIVDQLAKVSPARKR